MQVKQKTPEEKKKWYTRSLARTATRYIGETKTTLKIRVAEPSKL